MDGLRFRGPGLEDVVSIISALPRALPSSARSDHYRLLVLAARLARGTLPRLLIFGSLKHRLRFVSLTGAALLLLAVPQAAAAVAAPGARIAHASCSRATAKRLVNQDRLNDFLLPQPVVQVICGPFTGPRSQAMLVTIGAATCWSPQQWAVFRYTGGAWRLVTDKHRFIVSPVRASGGNLIVTSPVSRPGDSRCDLTGGTLTQTWHWNRSRFVVVATKRTPPPVHTIEFYASAQGLRVGCEIDDSTVVNGGQVICSAYSSTELRTAVLNGTGRVVACTQPIQASTGPCPQGNLGAPIPTYSTGKSIALGGYRCQVLQTGLQCTVIATGKGFLFGPSTVTPVGGATLRTT